MAARRHRDCAAADCVLSPCGAAAAPEAVQLQEECAGDRGLAALLRAAAAGCRETGDVHECRICLETHELCDTVVLLRLGQGCGHRFCRNCAAGAVDHALAEQEELQCPDCCTTVPDALVPDLAGERSVLLAQQREARAAKARRVDCPQCLQPFTPPDAQAAGPQLVCPLPQCACEFCPNCLQAPHAGHTCAHVRAVQGQWLQWQAEGQRQWLQESAAGERLREQLLQQEREAQRKVAEMRMCERAMVGMCKVCPHCGARFFRISGCDSIRCGDHNNGSSAVRSNFGCGARLNWAQCPDVSPADDIALIRELEAAVARRGQHKDPVRHGVDCSGCGAEITGLRFKCLTCAQTNLCVSCQQQQHGHERKGGAQLPHVCQILHSAEA